MTTITMNPNEGGNNGTTAGTSSSSTSILSEKVARALTVRTDTAAMKAALEALGHLEWSTTAASTTTTTTTTNSSSMTNSHTPSTPLDSRWVRTAMEHDALQQALALQRALHGIVDRVSALRRGCRHMADTASQLRTAIQAPAVIVTTMASNHTTSGMLPHPSHSTMDETTPMAAIDMDNHNDFTATSSSSSTTAQQQEEHQEQQLAHRLHDAFVQRDAARHRLDAVHAFLQAFDLSEHDSTLLDEYNFEDLISNNDTTTNNASTTHETDGWAFLQALQRVRKIRQALHQTFDNNSNNNDSGLGASAALRMMENLSLKQEHAYERLYHWLQQRLQLTSNNSNTTTAADATEYNFFPDSMAFLSHDNHHNDSSSSSSSSNDFVFQALHTLRHVPAFFNHLTELIATSRRASVTRQFLLALTTGTPELPPLEMKAHDSVAYVGDMLAFAFRTFSVEADLAKGLLLLPTDSEDSPNDDATGHKNDTTSNKTNAGMDDGDENDETLYSNYDTGNVEKAISARDMLAIVMSGLARPLKSRILHVVSSLTRRPDNSHDDDDIDNNDHEGTADFENLEEQGALVRTRVSQLYDICGLILFYVSTMEKSLLKLQQQQQTEQEVEENETNPLIQCLLESLTEASKGYEATIRGYSAMLEPLSIVSGMSEAHWVQQMLRLLSQVRLASPGFSLDIACPDEECQRILSLEWVTETLVESCWTKCTTIDTVVELKQGVLASKQAGMMMMQGSGSAVAEKLDAMMDEREASLIQELVRVETGMALEQCGLGNLVDAWKQWQIAEVNNQTKIAMYPRLSFHEVQAGIKEFYGSLYSPPLPSLEGTIQDPLARQSVRSQIAASVCTAYAGLYHSMAAAGSGYPDTLFLVHKPEEVVTLFSV